MIYFSSASVRMMYIISYQYDDNLPRIPLATNMPTYIDVTLSLTFSSMYGIPNAYIGVQPAPATTIPSTNNA